MIVLPFGIKAGRFLAVFAIELEVGKDLSPYRTLAFGERGLPRVIRDTCSGKHGEIGSVNRKGKVD